MKAALSERYGPPEVVVIKDVPKPVPGAGEVLVKAHATTVNSGDARIRALRVPTGMAPLMRLRLGLTKLRQPIGGFDMAGEVEAVDSEVSGFQPGDRVVGSRAFRLGCHAEYAAVEADGPIAAIPDNLSYQEAVALIFGGMTALWYLEAGKLAAGETVLINGASGAVGTLAVQIAKDKGAEVTAVCSGANAELVRSLGADHVVDYTKEDFTRSGPRYDVIMDNHGNAPFSRVKGSLAPDGRFLGVIIDSLWGMVSTARNSQVVGLADNDAMVSGDTFRRLMAMGEQGVLRPVIDRVLPFDQIVEAHRRVDTGHKVGSLVLSFDQPG